MSTEQIIFKGKDFYLVRRDGVTYYHNMVSGKEIVVVEVRK